MLLHSEGAFCVSIDCDDPPRSWHLELEVRIMWYHIESSKCGLSEQCVLATVERDDVTD